MEIVIRKWTPGSRNACRISLWRCRDAEKVHPPLRALCISGKNVEQAQRNGDRREPGLVWHVQRSIGQQTIGQGIGDVAYVEGRSINSRQGRVVNETL